MGHSICKLWKKEEVKILMIGLSSSGKTTILYRMKLGEVVNANLTIGFTTETVTDKQTGVTITSWKVGGRSKARPFMRYFLPNTDTVVFVVDSNDRDFLDEGVEEFYSYLQEADLKDSIVMILCNKQDIGGCLSVDEIRDRFLTNGHQLPKDIGIFPVVALDKRSLKEPFMWLSQEIAKKEMWALAAVSASEAQSLMKPVTHPIEFVKQSFSYIINNFKSQK